MTVRGDGRHLVGDLLALMLMLIAGSRHLIFANAFVAIPLNPCGSCLGPFSSSSRCSLDPLLDFMESKDDPLPLKTQQAILHQLEESGLNEFDTLTRLAQDFADRPEIFSSLLIQDFHFPPLLAHQTRAVVMDLLASSSSSSSSTTLEHSKSTNPTTNSHNLRPPENDANVWEAAVGSFSDPGPKIGITPAKGAGVTENDGTTPTRAPAKKKVIVNLKQSERRTKTGSNFEYGLPKDYDKIYPAIAQELEDYYMYMTEPSTSNQGEDPIRPATAKVYMTHAKLFLGWFITSHEDAAATGKDLSIDGIIRSKEKESAQPFIDFVMWLRRNRQVSAGYEANVLRGIIKLLKFRFRQESAEDASALTFADIPLIQEIRKLHRTANQKQRIAPKSSDEQKKWLSWPEYLTVIQKTKEEVQSLRQIFAETDPTDYRYRKGDTEREFSTQEEEIAQAFQRYLILGIFASIPDRQRTIRELELGRTLIRENDQWFVKHGPDDYKTGKAYGERPPMGLAAELTPALDEFVERWRPVLRPSTEFLFVQARTGNPLSIDSVFDRVTRCCFKYTGKPTNPHLLRSMIITHVREESNASEKELEALALFMGHSIQMQRSSYDKRTLQKKIAPAVELIQSVNQGQQQQPR